MSATGKLKFTIVSVLVTILIDCIAYFISNGYKFIPFNGYESLQIPLIITIISALSLFGINSFIDNDEFDD